MNCITRLTRALDSKNFYVVDDTKVQHDVNGYSGDAISKLAKFENIYDDLISKQSEISKELEKLRLEDKTHYASMLMALTGQLSQASWEPGFSSFGTVVVRATANPSSSI